MSTADNILAALALFTMEAPEWTVEAAAETLRISGSTAYRYFSSLTNAGLLDPTSGGKYVLGPAIIAYDRQLRLQDPLIRAAEPVMSRLVRRNGGEGVGLLCRRFRHQVMCVHQTFEQKPVNTVSYERGRPMPLYRGAAGLVILALLPSRTLRKLWSTNETAITAAGLGENWDAMRANLKAIRRAGFCITRGHIDKGMIGISAPIWLPERQSVSSISLVVAEGSASSSDIAGLTALVQAAAREINTGLAELDAGSDDHARPSQPSR